MLFVPFVPPANPRSPASPRAQELASRISKTIDDFQRNYPDASERDIRQALTAVSEGGGAARRPLVAALIAGIVAAVAGLVVFMRTAEGAEPARLQAPILVALLVVAIAVIVVVRNR